MMKSRTLINRLASWFSPGLREMNRNVRTPVEARTSFLLRLASLPVGTLSVEQGRWTFRYTPEFRARPDMRP
jgi:hypothetical protein